MQIYLIRLSYDRNFFGVVPQKNRKTVLGEILKKLKIKKFEVVSRTDKHVKAEENYIKIVIEEKIYKDKIEVEGIKILDIWELNEDIKIKDFVISKTYEYVFPKEYLEELYFLPAYIIKGSKKIWIRRDKKEFDEKVFKTYAKKLVGEKEFHNFTPQKYKDYRCKIIESYIQSEKDKYIWTIQGNRFLYQMIRRLSSFLVSMGFRLLDEEIFNEVFNKNVLLDPKPKTNPPIYLTLKNVKIDWNKLERYLKK